jgi:hypothetical protein
MFGLSLLTCQVSMVDTSTTVAITHNMQISLANGSNQFPIAWPVVQTPGTAIPTLAVALTDSNHVTLNKSTGAGSGGTYVVYVMRPNTAIG